MKRIRRLVLSSVILSLTGCTAVARLVAPDERATGGARARSPIAKRANGLTFASWNIRAGKDASLDGLADRLRALDADVIALQEVEVGTANSKGLDQADEIATRLGMERVFASTVSRDGGLYGIALLSRLPFRSVRRIELPNAMGLEPRVVIDADLDDGDEDGEVLHVLATHADVLPWAGAKHAAAIADHLEGRVAGRIVLLGDFNLTPESPGVRGLLSHGLRDAIVAFDGRPTGPPWPQRSRIDYVFMSPTLASLVESARVVDTDGSDHLPVVVKLRARTPGAIQLADALR